MYRAMIIGCGSIGATRQQGFDNPDNNETILTHSHALKFLEKEDLSFRDTPFKLDSFIEPDVEKRMAAMNKWNVHVGCSTLEDYLKDREMPDIVTIATPTETHFNIIKQILSNPKKPLCIVLEKPAGMNFLECSAIKHFSDIHKVPIVVNYTRRFNENIRAIVSLLKSGFYGNVLNASMAYTRGLLRDAPHAIDLFNWMFGEFISGRILNKEDCIQDYNKHDPTVAVHLKYEKCPHIFMRPCDGRAGSIFELDIICEKARIIFADNGTRICVYNVTDETSYGKYKTISSDHSCLLNDSLKKNLVDVYRNIYLHFNGEPIRQKLFCTIEDALKVHMVLMNLKD